MPRFLIGDERGQIKSLYYSAEPFEDGSRCKLTTLSHRVNGEQKTSIQRMAAGVDVGGSRTLLAGYSDGMVALSRFRGDDGLEVTNEWKESRFKKDSSFVGLATNSNKIYSCSSNGALQLTLIQDVASDTAISYQRSSLPTRLRDWKLSPDGSTFAYGGDEVELSVWNTEAAFQVHTEELNNSTVAPKKRKRDNDLFPGEIWRAKNVNNDSLGLRQPTRITSIDYLATGPSGHHVVTGTQLGDVRRYDTRTARRPVANWRNIGKVGGIQVVKRGLLEHELFVSDYGSNLFSLDLRNGRVFCAYKGLSGAVTSMAPSPGIMGSTANDRYARIHTTFPPPPTEGHNLEHKGGVTEKVYVVSIPTAIIWDDATEVTEDASPPSDEENDDVDDVWNDLEEIGDSDTETRGKNKRRHTT